MSYELTIIFPNKECRKTFFAYTDFITQAIICDKDREGCEHLKMYLDEEKKGFGFRCPDLFKGKEYSERVFSNWFFNNIPPNMTFKEVYGWGDDF